MQAKGKLGIIFSLLLILALSASSLTTAAQSNNPPPESDELELAETVKILLPNRDALNVLVDNGWDLTGEVLETGDGIIVTVVATPTQVAYLEELGFIKVDTTYDQQDWEARIEERDVLRAAPNLMESAIEATDTVTILRADYWQSVRGSSVSVEAKSSSERDATLTVSFEAAPIFGITCTQAVGFGNVPDGRMYQYSLRLSDPGTLSGTGHVTEKVWQGIIEGPAPLDVTVEWPMTPTGGNTPDDSAYSWEISEPGGLDISKGEGFFDCSAPLPTYSPVVSFTLSTFVDAGQYMYHRRAVSVNGRPLNVVVSSNEGGSATAAVREWLPDVELVKPYQISFVEHYMDPTELDARIGSLAEEFPEIAEIVELPYLTNGYRRQAMGLLGDSNTNRVVLTSHAWGHEGGNGITVQTVNPGLDQPLSIAVDGSTITISLATDAAGNPTSTAGDVIAALNDHPEASALVRADVYRLNIPSGLVAADQTSVLSDYLSAPPEIARAPFQMRALRIGRYRDGSKVGVMIIAQEHAREWQTPLVAIETAERLLRNYYNGGPSKQLVDNLDIFIIPSMNPDGGHYSFYDYASQRKNMTNYCLGGASNGLNSRNSWGVDINRNYNVGSFYDGYSGASSSCSGSTYAGPDELSEPENRNMVWVADTFANIKFGMSIHSSGNYFMWAPGAYKSAGRETLPRATLGQEQYFWQISERILAAIKSYRGTVVTPARTGPVVDVLYSAAGNSGDRLWYENKIYAWDFEVGTSFQPAWPEAYAEALEYSNGLIELFQIAIDLEMDNLIPISSLEDLEGIKITNQKLNEPAYLRFSNTEPSTIYYTLDGSRPTFSSLVYGGGVREPGSVLSFFEPARVNWFAVDAAGNISNNYRPDVLNSQSYNSVEVRFK